ncbi:MAG: hypothetical protein QOH89_3011, partial [Pseudonocardiales bacterium]|nr:hypothetical protein [Pseudonocardiales bacterium]
GDLVTADVTYAAPHHLVADGGVKTRRPWRGAAEPAHAAPKQQLLTIGSRPG